MALVTTSVLNGIGGAMLFVSLGLLLSDNASFTNRGVFNGFFLSVVSVGKIISSWAGSYLEDLMFDNGDAFELKK